ncbi:MAG: hypothetical protein QM529_00885 [Hydrotalea sp.]|nr:hypothetical protein [Hydrotalea sp.]
MAKKRAMTSAHASHVKRQGHADAKEFAQLIGVEDEYQNNPQDKKDVIDKNGDGHSVKSGAKKWQIFLYRQTRFATDNQFQTMNGVGQLMVAAIASFPATFEDYQKNKFISKEKLRPIMRSIKEKLQEKHRLKSFLEKSIFEGRQINYLTIKDNNVFHMFPRDDVLETLTKNIIVENSNPSNNNQKLKPGQFHEQKVIFKTITDNKKSTLGEIEMRNDSRIHFKEIKFWLYKKKTLLLLKQSINNSGEILAGKILFYGSSQKIFLRKNNEFLKKIS